VKRWRGTLVAFVVGAAIVTFGISYSSGYPTSLMTVVGYLSPAFVIGPPIVGLFFHSFDDPFFGIGLLAIYALTNGLLYALVWKLSSTGARAGQAGVVRAATLIPAALMVGLWTTSYVRTTAENLKPDPPPAPVDLTSPLAGRWEGALHSRAGELPVILVCHPRTDGTLDGYFYLDGVKFKSVAPLEEGTFASDSFRFTASSFTYQGRRDSTVMSIEYLYPADPGHGITLHFVSADTARSTLPPAPTR
jgi:hypothetical protein